MDPKEHYLKRKKQNWCRLGEVKITKLVVFTVLFIIIILIIYIITTKKRKIDYFELGSRKQMISSNK